MNKQEPPINTKLEYYVNEEMTKRLPVNEFGSPIVDWGESVPGEKKEWKFFIKNPTANTYSFRQPWTKDEDFTIKDFPVQLKPESIGVLVLEFAPKRTRFEPLNAGWGFEVIVS